MKDDSSGRGPSGRSVGGRELCPGGCKQLDFKGSDRWSLRPDVSTPVRPLFRLVIRAMAACEQRKVKLSFCWWWVSFRRQDLNSVSPVPLSVASELTGWLVCFFKVFTCQMWIWHVFVITDAFQCQWFILLWCIGWLITFYGQWWFLPLITCSCPIKELHILGVAHFRS